MSLGGGQNASPCAANYGPALTQAVANLYNRNVPIVAAVGNDGVSNAIAFPACLPKVIKVGSVSNDGQLATRSTFSNMPTLSNFPGEFFFMAPGGQKGAVLNAVTSASLDVQRQTGMLGTSQAAPHVAGAYSVVKAAVPTATVNDISNWLTANSPRTVGGIPVLRMPNL